MIILLASPLAISTIVGLAFSGLSNNDLPIEDVPVAIINHDRGNDFGVNYGHVFTSLLVPGAEQDNIFEDLPTCELEGSPPVESQASGVSLYDLTDSVLFDEDIAQALIDDGVVSDLPVESEDEYYLEAVARAAVEVGEYTALITIPEEFTQKITYVPFLHPAIEETGVLIYANSGRPISASIIQSIVEGISHQIVTGNIAIAATFEEMQLHTEPNNLLQAAGNPEFLAAFGCAFDPSINTVRLDPQSIETSSTGSVTTDVMVAIGSAQAMFFALFTATFGVLSMHDDKRNWTLQRLVMSPTPKWMILAGKLTGTFISVLFQVSVLLIALTVIGSVLQGQLVLIWGNDMPRLIALLLAVGLAVSGFGTFMAGIAKTPEQGQIFGGVAAMAMTVLGGGFGFSLPDEFGVFSIVYWGRDAFDLLAAGNPEIGINLSVLVIQGLIMFVIGVLIFNRRFEL
jgi:ABC-2 type transport system permease protein